MPDTEVPTKVVFKDEDELPNGESIGPIWVVYDGDRYVGQSKWGTRRNAETLSDNLGVPFEES